MTKEESYDKGYADGMRAYAYHMELCKEEQDPKQGHWIKNEKTFWTCDICGLVNHYNRKKYNYCPNCGARMSE